MGIAIHYNHRPGDGGSPPPRTPSLPHQGQCDPDERSGFGYGGCIAARCGQQIDERCDVQVVGHAATVDICGRLAAVRELRLQRCFIGGRKGADKRRDVKVVYAAVAVHVAEQDLGQANRIQ